MILLILFNVIKSTTKKNYFRLSIFRTNNFDLILMRSQVHTLSLLRSVHHSFTVDELLRIRCVFFSHFCVLCFSFFFVILSSTILLGPVFFLFQIKCAVLLHKSFLESGKLKMVEKQTF